MPTGTVQFTDGGGHLGAAVTLAGGTAALTVPALAVGNHVIAAIYSGDANNFGSVSAAITQVVTAGSGGNPAVPTMPGWAVMLLCLLLISIAAQRRGGRLNHGVRTRAGDRHSNRAC
jgi:hypothetical protein